MTVDDDGSVRAAPNIANLPELRRKAMKRPAAAISMAPRLACAWFCNWNGCLACRSDGYCEERLRQGPVL
jgi:hypothetical protein